MADERTDVQKLLDQWDENIQYFSDPGSMMADQCYRKLIPYGTEVVEEIMRRMRLGQFYFNYFLLLRRLCNFDPVPPQIHGKVQEMGFRWIEWWENRHDPAWWETLAEKEGITSTEYGVKVSDVASEQTSS